MPAPAIRVEGLRELQSAIRRAKDTDLGRRLRVANKTIAQAVVSRALPNTPRKTGRLAASVKALATQTSASVKAGTPARVPYAAVQHWGWAAHGIEAKPFLTDAAASVERASVEIYAKAVDDVMQQFSAR